MRCTIATFEKRRPDAFGLGANEFDARQKDRRFLVRILSTATTITTSTDQQTIVGQVDRRFRPPNVTTFAALVLLKEMFAFQRVEDTIITAFSWLL